MRNLTPDFWYNLGQATWPIAAYMGGWASRAFAEMLKRAKKKRQQWPIVNLHRTDVEIILVLDRLLYQLGGAIRVYLVQYHNGQHFQNENDIMRQSRTHERVRPGISYQSDLFQGIMVSTMPEETKLVLAPGSSFTPVAAVKGSRFSWVCEQGGVAAVARCAIRDKSNTVTGFVGADFETEKEPANSSEICAAAYRIGQILSNNK